MSIRKTQMPTYLLTSMHAAGKWPIVYLPLVLLSPPGTRSEANLTQSQASCLYATSGFLKEHSHHCRLGIIELLRMFQTSMHVIC